MLKVVNNANNVKERNKDRVMAIEIEKQKATIEYLSMMSGIEIPDEDAEKITTVQQAIDYAKAHQKA